uniref:Auxin response factor n=1 Tax=Ceratopteris pteridoides TaxID=58167 RepID=A0A1X9T654_9MONI|nr:auxin response factor 10 [Ceratopteris pteridoides]
MPGLIPRGTMDERPASRASANVLPSSDSTMPVKVGSTSCGSRPELDPQLWRACAGAMVHMPRVGSKVIYFPQGHAEHAASMAEFSSASMAIPCMLLCRVLSVKLLADSETDEVYACIRLQPDINGCLDPDDEEPASPPLPEKTASFAKTLTQSDANNGGGFSVPRYCAETIFPRLDYSQDPPVQIVLAKDVHGTVWKFRHIYRGTPRRHLLTTGWSNFVNQKKLVAGDAIVFLRNAAGELCVGVRRSTRGATTNINASAWQLAQAAAASSTTSSSSSSWKLKPPDNSLDLVGSPALNSSTRSLRASCDSLGTANFARNRVRVTAKDVIEAASLAASGKVFEVLYYPRTTISEFCVKAHAVRTSLQLSWAPGMRFKMAVETEDASRISWFMGTISRVQEVDASAWPKSPWKMLQVMWDEPEILQGIMRVSPWQVELVSPMQLPLFSLPKKRSRLSQLQEFHLDGMGMPMTTLASNLLSHINPWHELAENESAGMQGARHDGSYTIRSSHIGLSDVHHNLFRDYLYAQQGNCGMASAQISAELNTGSLLSPNRDSRPLRTLMPMGGSCSSDSVLSSDGTSLGQGESCTSSKNTPFLLFGKAIDTSQSSDSQSLRGNIKVDDATHGTTADGSCRKIPSQTHMFFSGEGIGPPHIGKHDRLSQEQIHCPPIFDSGRVGWFKENTASGHNNHSLIGRDCVFAVGKGTCQAAVDLSLFNSYEELQENLSKAYGFQKSEMFNRLICVDSRPIENEPYRDFTRRVKCLKLLSEFSGEEIAR